MQLRDVASLSERLMLLFSELGEIRALFYILELSVQIGGEDMSVCDSWHLHHCCIYSASPTYVTTALSTLFMDLLTTLRAAECVCVPAFCRQLLLHHQAPYYATGWNPSGSKAQSALGQQMVSREQNIWSLNSYWTQHGLTVWTLECRPDWDYSAIRSKLR